MHVRTTAFAEPNSADGLTAVLETDKTDYAAGETINVTLDVTNTSIYVSNIRTELIIPEGITLADGQLTSDPVAVTGGESIRYTYALATPAAETTTTQAPTTQAPTTQAPADSGDNAQTGDITLFIYGGLAILSLVGLVALTFGGKLLKQRWFVLILCGALLVGIVGPVAANAAVTEKTFDVTKTITIDGVAAEVKAIVTYDLDDGELLASEVEFKKDGKSLYALVPEKGWYTAANASIVVDGVAATNNTRPEVTASYIDMLFGCTSTKTGNFVKGEFTNSEIISDDAELELLVGLTDDVASRKALDHIAYDEWIIAEIDGKVVVTGWFDDSTAAAARHLYNLVNGQENVTLSLPITGKVEGFTTDIPEPSVGTFNGGMNGSEGTLVLRYGNMDEEKFETYAQDLESAGYELYAENEILNYGEAYNLFKTYVKGDSVVHIMYTPDDFVYATDVTANEQAYLSRSFRPEGCEMRIVTDHADGLFTNEENNDYTDAGITPKMHIVNLYNQVADGNNNAECIIYTLADGSFIVCDGGFSQDMEHLYKALTELNEREDGKIVVAAWIMSHHHSDHIGAIKALAETEYAKEIYIEQFIYNPTAPTYYWRLMNAPYNYTGDFNDSVYNHAYISGLLAKFGDGNTQIVNPHMGQRMYIRNAEVEFMYTGDEDLYPVHMDNTNDSSMVYTVNFGAATETTDDDAKVLMLNDNCLDAQYHVLMPLYSQVMDCDIVQVGHHGLGGPSSSLYRMMEPDIAIWCSTESTAIKNNWFVPKTNEDGSLAGGTAGGSAGYLLYRLADDDNDPVELYLMAEHYVQTIELPWHSGDVIDKRILTDYYTGLYATEEVDVAFLPAFRFQGTFNAKYEDIVAELESYDADVMILTQIDQLCTVYNNADVIGKLMEDLDFTYYAYAPVWNANKDFSGNLETGEGTMGHLILSRYPITSAESVVLVEGNTTKWATPEGRGFCHAVLDVDGLSLDIYATHLSDDSIGGFNAALAGDHKPTGDYWMIVGNCNKSSYETGVSAVAPVAANLNGGDFEVYGDENIEFVDVQIHDVWDTITGNANMDCTYTFTAKLSRYLASDSVREQTPETDLMLWCTNNYGGSTATLSTIIGELKYVHPEIAVIVMADNNSVSITPAELAEQTGYAYYSYVEAWTYHATRTDRSRGSIILSDIPMTEMDKVVLTEDGTSTEGRAFGHVVMTIDGVETDVWFGFNNSNAAQVTQLEPYVQAVAEETGRQFIVAGYKFEAMGKTYAGKTVKKGYLSPGYTVALSEGELQIATTENYSKANLGITSAMISDQVWVTFGEPSMEDMPLENTFMQWWLGRVENESQVDLIVEEIRKQNPAICALINLSNQQYADFDPVDIAEALGYPYYDYAKYYDADGTHKGYLILSKYPIEFQESKTTDRSTAIFWYTTEIDGRPLDLYVGHDFVLSSFEDWIKTNADADNSDFVVFGHYLNTYPDTFAGRPVSYVNNTTNYLLMSTNNMTTSNPVCNDKPEGLTHDANGKPLTMDFEMKDLGTTAMAWWLNGWQNETEVNAMIEQIQEQDVDIAVIVSAGDFRYAEITPEEFAAMTGYEYWRFEESVTNENGTRRGNLILSKTKLNYDGYGEYVDNNGNTLKCSHLTTTINYREIDLFMCYDATPAKVEAYIKGIVDASGNDFLIFGHNFSSLTGTAYAGKDVVYINAGTTYLVASQENQTVLGTKTVAKHADLSWAGHSDQAHMEIEVTPKPTTDVMAWWLNGWQTESDALVMAEEIKAQDQDIAVVLSAGNFRYAGLTVEQFAELTGYEYWYYETVVTNEDGTVRGNLMLSKTELDYDGYFDENGLKFSHLTTTLGENEVDLFMGYDVTYGGVEAYVKETVEASGNDFLIFAFNFDGIKNEYAGHAVEFANDPVGIHVVASGKDQTVLETFITPKPTDLAWAGYCDQVHMKLDIGTPTPEKPAEPEVPEEPVETTTENVRVMNWWVLQMNTAAEVETVIARVAEEDPDIAVLLNVKETTDGAVDVDAIANALNYPYYAFCTYGETDGVDNGYLLMSRYPLTHKETVDGTQNGTSVYYYTAEISGKGLDLYVGHDWNLKGSSAADSPSPVTYQDWIKANAEASGNDFIIFGHYCNGYPDTYADKSVEYTNSSTIYLMASTDELKVTAKECKDKPASLTDAGINSVLVMDLEVSVPVQPKTMDLKLAAFPTNKFLNGKFSTNQAAVKEWLDANADADIIAFTLVDVNCVNASGSGVWNKMDVYTALKEILSEKYPYSEFAKVWYAYNDPANADASSNDGWIGHVIFSKYEITNFETLVQVNDGDPSTEDRAAGYATIKVGDATVDVFVMGNGGAAHWNGAVSDAIKASTADAWFALGSMHCKASTKAEIEGYLDQTISVAETTDSTGYYIVSGSNVTFKDAVANDVSTFNYYQWHTATAVITY